MWYCKNYYFTYNCTLLASMLCAQCPSYWKFMEYICFVQRSTVCVPLLSTWVIVCENSKCMKVFGEDWLNSLNVLGSCNMNCWCHLVIEPQIYDICDLPYRAAKYTGNSNLHLNILKIRKRTHVYVNNFNILYDN